MKLKWKVAEAPTGRYRTFQKRGWPSAYVGEYCVAIIDCEDDYTPARARGEINHMPLIISVANRNKPGPFDWKRLRNQAETLTEAKSLVTAFFHTHPDWLPS